MAESKKAMEQRHAKTLGKIAKEEAQEAKEYAKGGAIDGVARKGRTSVEQVKMACGGKAKKYAGGGGVTEGLNANIDDDTRQRALSWAASGGDNESSDSAPAPRAKPVVRRAAPAPAAKPAASEASEASTPSASGKGFRGHMSDADARPTPQVKEPKKTPAFDPAKADYSEYKSGTETDKPTYANTKRMLEDKSYDGALPDEAYLGLGGAGVGAAARAGLDALRGAAGSNALKAAGETAASAERAAATAARSKQYDTAMGAARSNAAKAKAERAAQSEKDAVMDAAKARRDAVQEKSAALRKSNRTETQVEEVASKPREWKPANTPAPTKETADKFRGRGVKPSAPGTKPQRKRFAEGGKIQTSFAKGGSVKGWGISRHTNKFKVV